ncbi:MAG TPA: polysaccharide biosynthesis tyrosine autokinase [Solirubrobacterales bacterium]|nr:polysaccharide biosynthesis tyrosine autokinase [Solirubrobacterales bacterium]
MAGELSKEPQVNPEGVLEQLLRTVRRRKWIVLQATIVVPLLALVFSLSQEDEYTATATLLFRQAPSGIAEGTENVIDPTREAATNGQLVGLPVIAEKAAESLPGASGEEVLEDVSVEPSSEADTAKIIAITGSADLSAEMANAYGSAYIDFRRNADRSQVQDAIDVAESSLEKLTPAEREGKEGAALGEQLDHLKLSQALQTGGAELVQPARPPSGRSSPQPLRNVLLGFVLGALLGLGLAALLERIDRRVRTVDELEELYEAPILARIPRSQRLTKRRAEAIGPQTPEGEAFRVLRTNLRYFNLDKGLRSILVTSPEAGDGKSTVARTLATTMVEMGDDVILVEGDLRKGGDLIDVAGKPATGLSNVLTGTPVEKVLMKVDVPATGGLRERTLTVLPSGPVPPNPSELLESAQMRELLAQLQEQFDVVVLDSPALAAVSDALALISEVTTVVIVGGLGRTTRDAGRELSKQFALLGKKPVGVIANFTEPERGKYSHYYHSDLARSTPGT